MTYSKDKKMVNNINNIHKKCDFLFNLFTYNDIYYIILFIFKK